MRYGAGEPAWQRLDDRVRSHRGRLRFIDEQIAELEAEKRRLRTEIRGFEKALVLVRRSEVDRLRKEHAEAWSPVPVRGYRVWTVHRDGLHGARMRWPEPNLTAECTRGGRDEVPHSDGRCGPPACGIYAAKHPDLFFREFSTDWLGAMGLVELSGKVVEHTEGYRAQHARVVALGLVGRGRSLVTHDPAVIELAFADPDQALVRWGSHHASPRESWARISEYLISREEQPWTSESNSA
jgi:hypothetical protein